MNRDARMDEVFIQEVESKFWEAIFKRDTKTVTR